jgi:DNA-binding transcriptional MocR family regulator
MRMTVLPDIQLVLRPGIVEMQWGNPDPALLPVDDIARATDLALRRDGPRALAYGAEQGPRRLLEPLAAWLAGQEGRAISPADIFVTGGVSQGLDLLCTLLTRPGDAILVQSPVYHLALRIFADHGLELVPVASDDLGLRVDDLAAVLEALPREGRTARFLYLVPTFCNPTGISLAAERRAALARLAEAHGLTILEDDVYRELWYDSSPPAPLQSSAEAGTVIRLGSFSKILAPGLRLGWLIAAPKTVARCVNSGLLDSGGGVNHFTAHAAAAYLDLGLMNGHIERLRTTYRERRDALLEATARFLPTDCRWTVPGGGFFLWLQLPEGCDSSALLPFAEQAGVSYVPGTRFCTGGGGERHLRLSFSLLSAAELAEGARRLGEAIHSAALCAPYGEAPYG